MAHAKQFWLASVAGLTTVVTAQAVFRRATLTP